MIISKTSLDALFRAFNMAFRNGLGMAESQYDRISMTIPSATAANTYPWLGKLPSMREWLGDRVIENLSLHDYTIRNRAFEQTVGVRGSDIEDDQYGIRLQTGAVQCRRASSSTAATLSGGRKSASGRARNQVSWRLA